MAKAITVKEIALCNITPDIIGFEIGLALEDSGVVTPATYEIDMTSGTTIAMVGITQYGRVTGQYTEATKTLSVDITATPLGDDGTNKVVGTATLAELIALTVGDTITSESVG